jgi:transaldolase
MGPYTVNTLPENTLEALLQSAKVKDELTNNTDVDRYFNNLEKDGLSVNQITYELLADGIRSFLESYNSVIDRITNKIIK